MITKHEEIIAFYLLKDSLFTDKLADFQSNLATKIHFC